MTPDEKAEKRAGRIYGASKLALLAFAVLLVGGGLALSGSLEWGLVAMGSMLFAAQAIDNITAAVGR